MTFRKILQAGLLLLAVAVLTPTNVQARNYHHVHRYHAHHVHRHHMRIAEARRDTLNHQDWWKTQFSFDDQQSQQKIVFRSRIQTRKVSRGWESSFGARPIMRVAESYLGRGKFTRYGGPWCRDFVNVVARQAGYRLANSSRTAIDALHLGRRVSSPQPGDLVVMRHHVTFFAGYSHSGKIIGLGGNQSHRVRYSQYPTRRVLAFVRL